VSEPIDQLRATVAAVPPPLDAMAGYLRKVHERAYTVTDAYTAQTHSVQGLSGVFAVRFGESTPIDVYCMQHSTATAYINSTCSANLTPGFLNLAYVGVSETPSYSSEPRSSSHSAGNRQNTQKHRISKPVALRLRPGRPPQHATQDRIRAT